MNSQIDITNQQQINELNWDVATVSDPERQRQKFAAHDRPKQPFSPPEEALPSLLEIYMSELPEEIHLSRKEEAQLALRIQQGEWAKQRLRDDPPEDVQSRQALEREAAEGHRAWCWLVCINLRLVVRIALSRRFRQSGLPLLDLIQEANLSLMRAARQFPANFRYRFSTYVWRRVHTELRRAIERDLRDAGFIPNPARKKNQRHRRRNST